MSLPGTESLTTVITPSQEERVAQLLRVQNFNVSSDGIGAGEDQTLERPFGHAEPEKLFAWAGATASWPMRTDPGGSRGLDDYLTRDYARNIGAEIMGRNKFGPQRGPWHDHEWQGWWGDEPPFRTPVFVLTHHKRPSLTLSDTTFHFVDGSPCNRPRAGPGGGAGQGRPTRRRGHHHQRVSRRRPRRHHACGGLAGEARFRSTTLGVPR